MTINTNLAKNGLRAFQKTIAAMDSDEAAIQQNYTRYSQNRGAVCMPATFLKVR